MHLLFTLPKGLNLFFPPSMAKRADWLIDWFYQHVNMLQLFYAQMLGNHNMYIFWFTFLYSCFLRFFYTQSYQIQIIDRSIWPINGTITDTTSPGQSGFGSKGNEEVLQNWSFTIMYSLVSYSGHLLFKDFTFLQGIQLVYSKVNSQASKITELIWSSSSHVQLV